MSEDASIVQHVSVWLLATCRLGGMLCYGPVFGSAAIPGQIRVMLSIGFAGAACALLAARGEVAGWNQPAWWSLIPLAATEAMLGLLIGFVAGLPLLAVQSGGLLISQQMGLGFGQLVNPTAEGQIDVVGQVLQWSAVAGFLMVGGHEWTLLAVLRSFEHLPLGHVVMTDNVAALLAGALGASMELAVRVAAPLTALLCLESVAMGVLARSVPQLNVLTVGFPIRIAAGIGLLAAGICAMQDTIIDAMGESMQSLFWWIDGCGTRSLAGANDG